MYISSIVVLKINLFLKVSVWMVVQYGGRRHNPPRQGDTTLHCARESQTLSNLKRSLLVHNQHYTETDRTAAKMLQAERTMG